MKFNAAFKEEEVMQYTLYQKNQEEIALDPGMLDAGERERFQRLIDPERQAEFLAGRCFLKEVLSTHLGVPARAVSLSVTASGRPYLPAVYGSEVPHFSLSHAAGRYLVGLSPYPVGVDIEPFRELSARQLHPFLSLQEQEHLLGLAEAEQPVQLLRLFTMKEALIKATDRRWGLDEISFAYKNEGWILEKPTGAFSFHFVEEAGFFWAVCLFLPPAVSSTNFVKIGLKPF